MSLDLLNTQRYSSRTIVRLFSFPPVAEYPWISYEDREVTLLPSLFDPPYFPSSSLFLSVLRFSFLFSVLLLAKQFIRASTLQTATHYSRTIKLPELCEHVPACMHETEHFLLYLVLRLSLSRRFMPFVS